MNMASRTLNITCPSLTKSIEVCSFLVDEAAGVKGKLSISAGTTKCSAVKQSATAAAAAAAETKVAAPKSVKPKVAVKPLAVLMEEEVIPPLKATFEAQNDLSEIQVSFQDNRLEGSFTKNAIPYSFWAFFPDGSLTGARGFSLSSYGSGVSTVEPFLIDEKKITAKHVVFWVEKRLAAQGILPVWKQSQ